MTSTDVAVAIAVVLGILLIGAVIAGLRAGGATRSASQRAADAGERLAASRRRLTELEAELYEARRQLAAFRAPTPDPSATPAPPAPVVAAADSASGGGAPAPSGSVVAAADSASGGGAPAPSGSVVAAADSASGGGAPGQPVEASSGTGRPVEASSASGSTAPPPASPPAAEAPDEAKFAVDGAIPPEPSEIAADETDEDRDVIDAVWSLERLELDGQRQREAGILTAPAEVADGTLVGALQREVERIREEMGTPGELHNELPDDPEGRAGLLMLGAVRMTLGALARRCQAFDLRLEAQDGRLKATLVCEGFEAESAEETSAAIDAIAAAVASAGVTATFSPGVDGAAHAELSFPAH